MAHLTSAELIDLVEGGPSGSSASHLQSCPLCQRQAAELRATLTMVTDIEVPEPSPLFWDHLSARVRDALDAGGAESSSRRDPGGASTGGWLAWLHVRLGWAAGLTVAAVTLALAITGISRSSSIRRPAPSTAARIDAVDEPTVTADDPSLSLVADLLAEWDWESAREAGLVPRVGGDDAAFTQLSDGERRELRELLKRELTPLRRGAS